MVDCFTTPPFFCLAAAPVAALSLDAPDTASPGPLPTPISRVMFDDASNDIVVFTGDGAISFFHLRRDDIPTPAASSVLDDSGANTGENGPRGCREGDWVSEITSPTDLVLTLRIKHKPGTCLPSLRVAKRFPSPIAASMAAASPPSAAAHHRRRAGDPPPPAYLVALSHDERHLFFYQCPGTDRVGPGAVGHENGTPPMPCPVISAFCKYECHPSNLRYQQDHYQIRFYVWVRQSPPSRPQQHRLPQEGECAPGSALSRPRCAVADGRCVTSSSSRHRGTARMLCTSSVCIDLLAIEPHPPSCRGSSDDRTGVIVLARYPTHTDTWLYDARTGLLLSVNILEHPDIVKPFRVGEDRQSIVPGPKLQLPASLPHTTVTVRRNPRDPRADSTTLGLYVGIVTLYDQPFMYAIRPRSSVCALYSYAHPTSPDAEEGEGSYTLFAVLSMAEFPCVRYYCAAAAAAATGRTSDDTTPPMPIPSSSLTAPAILVHAVDNLLLLHAVEDDLISAFDVGLANSDDYCANHRRRQQLFTLEASINATESSFWMASNRKVGRPRPNTLSTAAASLCHAVSRRVAPGTIGRETPLYEADRLDTQKMQPLRPLATTSLRMLSREVDTPMAEEGDQYCMTSAGWPLVCRCDRVRQWAAFRIHLNPFSLLAGLADTATTERPMQTRTLQVQFLLQRVGCGGEAVPRIVAGLLTGPAAHRVELPAVWAVIVTHHLHQRRMKKTSLPLTSGSLEMEHDGGVARLLSSEQPRLTHHDVLCNSLFSVSPSPSAVALATMASRRSYSQQDIWTLVVEPLWPTPETAPAAALGLFSTLVQLARCLLRCGEPLEPCTAIALLRVVDASVLWADGGTLVEGLSEVLEVAFVKSGGRLVVPNECVAEAMLTAYDGVVARGAHPTLRASLFTPAVSMLKQVVGIVRAVQACLTRHQLTPAIALCEEVPSSDSTTGAVAMRAVLTYQLHQLTTHQERGDHAALAAARRSYTWTYARFVCRLPQMGLREFSGPRHVTV